MPNNQLYESVQLLLSDEVLWLFGLISWKILSTPPAALEGLSRLLKGVCWKNEAGTKSVQNQIHMPQKAKP